MFSQRNLRQNLDLRGEWNTGTQNLTAQVLRHVRRLMVGLSHLRGLMAQKLLAENGNPRLLSISMSLLTRPVNGFAFGIKCKAFWEELPRQ
jgi:hypothetical protein